MLQAKYSSLKRYTLYPIFLYSCMVTVIMSHDNRVHTTA